MEEAALSSGSNDSSPTTPTKERQRAKSLLTSSPQKRLASSTTILTKFPVFRADSFGGAVTQSPAEITPFPKDLPINNNPHDYQPPRNPALESVIEAQSKSRKRKGSLRKTALLTGGRLRLDRRSSASVEPSKHSPTQPDIPKRQRGYSQASAPSPTKRAFNFELPTANSSTDNLEEEKNTGGLSLDTSAMLSPGSTTTLSPFTSPTALSVTSDDDGLLISLAHSSITSPPTLLPPPHPDATPSPSPPSSESSLPNALALHRRRPTKAPIYTPSSTASKPSITSPPTPAPMVPIHATDEWDYSDTEWWGWIILLVTWIVVVVGMGSCLGVWSWAWDVGRTPYAPPELEDDPTLPIVGYYPALMVLTGIVSWVWVVVAWVGMKYFKHAKIQSED